MLNGGLTEGFNGLQDNMANQKILIDHAMPPCYNGSGFSLCNLLNLKAES